MNTAYTEKKKLHAGQQCSLWNSCCRTLFDRLPDIVQCPLLIFRPENISEIWEHLLVTEISAFEKNGRLFGKKRSSRGVFENNSP